MHFQSVMMVYIDQCLQMHENFSDRIYHAISDRKPMEPPCPTPISPLPTLTPPLTSANSVSSQPNSQLSISFVLVSTSILRSFTVTRSRSVIPFRHTSPSGKLTTKQ